MKMLVGIRHLSLDLWLTIIRSNPAFKPARNRLFVEHFGLDQPADEVLRIFQEWDRRFNVINEQTGRNLSVHEMLYIILAALGKAVDDISLTRMNDFLAAAEGLFFEHPPLLLEPDITGTLAAIKESGITVSLLSNTAFIKGETLRQALPKLGLKNCFDFQLYSDEMERSKPSPDVFSVLYNKALALRSLKKEEILHVGDNRIADYEGARKAGFKALHFNPQTETLSHLLRPLICTPPLPCTT